MKKCQFCAEDIQDAAIICKHCGREIQALTSIAAQPATEKKKSRGLMWVSVGILGLLAIGIVAKQASTDATPSKTMAVRVAWSSLALQVTNNDASAAGQPMTVYINGTPPNAYKATSLVPSLGGTVELPLMGFVNRSGDRFNPMAKAVTEAWVGGGDYDFEKYGK